MEFADVEEEYKKNKELNKEDIHILQEWAQKQLHLPPITELQYILFLHSCHWSLEHTKTTIDKFFTYRTACPSFFRNRNPFDSVLKVTLDHVVFKFLPRKMPENYRILFFKMLDLDINNFIAQDIIKVMDMYITLEYMRCGTSDGLIIIIDLQGFTAGHILKMNVMDLKKFLTYLQEAIPVRLKALYYVNVKSIVELLTPIIKPFIKPELLGHLLFMDSYEKLFKFVPQELFPKDIGGNEPTVDEMHKGMLELLELCSDFFYEDEKLTSNEARRDRRPSYMDKDFGIGADGSFKKLVFD